MRLIYRIFLYYVLILPVMAIAYQPYRSQGVGRVATNMMEPVTILANFIGSMSIVIGLSFLLGAVVKYSQHRMNPMAVPISTVVLLLIMGVLLVSVPFAYKLTDTGVPISL
jgi:Ca2+/H+ antiporter